MSAKRLLVVFGIFLAMFGVVMGRLFLLASNTEYAARAREQTVSTLELPAERGNIYDCNGQKLTGAVEQWYALAVPGDAVYTTLFDYVPYSYQSLLYQKAQQAASPFLIPVDRDLSSLGIYSVHQARRSLPLPIAVHLLGYLDGEGHGVTGIEAAFDDILWRGESQTVTCITTARGSLLQDTDPQLQTVTPKGQGVQLTLDTAVQRVVEGVAGGMEKGCILVLDTADCAIRAAVSAPAYDPNRVSASIDAENSPLVNRCFAAYNVGSVFKPLLAAAALDAGWDAGQLYECKGWIEVDGQVYRCAQGIAHGTIDLEQALEQSCNGYFVQLGQWLGGEKALQTAQAAGFGQEVYLAPGYKSAAGTLPSEEAIASSGELANFSFGQGQLTGTPLQVAAMMNALASDGVWRTPYLVQGTVDEATGETSPLQYESASRQVMTKATAAVLRGMLGQVVQEGLGQKAMPSDGSAGGKTGTAQTGRFSPGGEEYTDLWFAGFWPLEHPRYTIVVMLDETTALSSEAAALFAQVCDGLRYLDAPETDIDKESADAYNE